MAFSKCRWTRGNTARSASAAPCEERTFPGRLTTRRHSPVPASETIKPASRSRRRNYASQLMSVLRGDKHMVNANPPAWRKTTNALPVA